MALLLAAAAACAQAHDHEHMGSADAELGSVTFETSCRPQVASDINRGVALLHSFWHDEALRTFEAAAAADPQCAMAWWGQGMALFHLYSSTPSDKELAAGAQALAKADAASEKTPREAAYIRAVHLLFEGFKPREYAASAQRFADAMRTVSGSYPKDLDAKAFYALGLLAAIPSGDLTLTNARKAVDLLYPAFRQHPDHPGLAHYIIHACDHPQMAKRGLEAARRYASIAPAAPHALHMPSHIFARLGLWDDDIASNLASKTASEVTTGPHIGAENRLHAMEFLEYAYLQSGRFEEARQIAAEALTVKRADTSYDDYYLTVQARFQMLLAIETRNWARALQLAPVDGAHWYSEAHTLLARAEAAGHLRDAAAGRAAASRWEALMEKVSHPQLPEGSSSANLRDEIQAWSAFAQGDVENAIRLVRATAALQDKVGKGEVELPAREMVADMLLLSGQASEALKEYERSLKSDPNRFNAVLGAREAAEKSGHAALAAKYYRQLQAIAPHANGGAQSLIPPAAGVSAE